MTVAVAVARSINQHGSIMLPWLGSLAVGLGQAKYGHWAMGMGERVGWAMGPANDYLTRFIYFFILF